MKTWTKEERYRILNEDSISEVISLNKKIKDSRYRQTFHIQPHSGLLNDPNGFSYFDGKWHLFYQWFPFGPIHGMKHWYHVESSDLSSWKNLGLGLKPSLEYDNYGVYSGSAFSTPENLYLFYTGNNRDENWIRHPYQCLAKMDTAGKIEKFNSPIISEHKDYTEHQRDPKIIFDEVTDKYYILLGAQTKDLKGRIIAYSLENPGLDNIFDGEWKFEGEINVVGYEDFGYMWECPDLIKIGEKYVLLFSPQGLNENFDKTKNIFQNGYIIGNMDFKKLEFTPESKYLDLDYGFDFYASQTAVQNQSIEIKDSSKHQPNKEEENVLIAWMGLPDLEYPTDSELWSGCMSLPRELSLNNNRLIQNPVKSLKKLRDENIFSGKNSQYSGNLSPSEIIIEASNNSMSIDLFKSDKINSKTSEENSFKILYNSDSKIFSIDRGNMENIINANYGTTRSAVLNEELKNVRIFVDNSSVEIFVNDGRYSFTSRVFPSIDENQINISSESDLNIQIWTLKNGVEEDFKI